LGHGRLSWRSLTTRREAGKEGREREVLEPSATGDRPTFSVWDMLEKIVHVV
jgi:hypothetical protein